MEGVDPLWPLYFPNRPYDVQFDNVARKFIPFFRGYRPEISDSGTLAINFAALVTGCAELGVPLAKPDFASRPDDTLAVMELAAHRVYWQPQNRAGRIFIRVLGFPDVTKLKKMKANRIGKFFSLKGTVVRVGGVLPLVKRMSFSCDKCGTVMPRCFPAGIYDPPTSCFGDGCRARKFSPDRQGCATVDCQRVKLQEVLDDDLDAGRIPRTIDVELTNDLVDCCVPGDIVTVSGIVRSIRTEKGPKGQAQALFYLYIEANSVANSKTKKEAVRDGGQGTWGSEDMLMIDQIKSLGTSIVADGRQSDASASQQRLGLLEQSQPIEIFRLLTNSLCPGIFGHEMVKAGMILSMLSGVGRGGGVNQLAIRGDP